MKLGLTFAALGLIGVAGLAIAADVDVTKLPPASSKKDLTYEKDIQPILKASCFNCHGPTGRARGGLKLDTLEAALKGGTDGKVIAPGDGTKSQIVIATSRLDPEKAMPPTPRRGRGPGAPGGPGGAPGGTNAAAGGPPAGGPPGGAPGRGPAGPPPKNLTPEEVGLIRAWIDQGAK